MVFVAREIDDAIGNNHVHGTIWKRDVLCLAFEKLNVSQATLALILFRR